MKVKNNIEKEKIENQKYIPVFMFIYNIIEIIGLIIFLFVVLFVIVLPDESSIDLLSVLLLIQLIGLAYFIPFYLFPEIFFIFKYNKYRNFNITLTVVSSIIYSLIYPIFKLVSLII